MNDTLPREKVYRVLELLSQKPSASQRELADKTGSSLGMINLTLKRLIQTGHIKVSALNRRKLQYLLTPKGMVGMTNKSAQYIVRTIETFSEYKNRIDVLIKELVAAGHTSFALLGQGEVSSIVELLLHQQGPRLRHRYIQEGDPIEAGDIVLDCRLRNESGGVGISILEKLLQMKTIKENGSIKMNAMEAVGK